MMPASNGTGGINALRSLAWAGIDSRIAGGGSMLIYNQASAPFTRRSACWAFGLVGISALCADQSMTLISPNIALYAIHFPPTISSTATFVAEDGSNTNYTRTVAALHPLGLPYPNTASGDIGVALLSSTLPAPVQPARLCVAGLMNFFMPVITVPNLGIPILESTAENEATVNNWNGTERAGLVNAGVLYTAVPSTAPRSDYYIAKEGGDSGRGCGMVVSGEFLSLMSLATAGGGGTGWGNWQYLSLIDAAIATLGGQARASTFDPATL